jgi:ABC-2 type transport system ATP-binding protein
MSVPLIEASHLSKHYGRLPALDRLDFKVQPGRIADTAVLPRWLRVSQALDFVAAVHPRLDRARAEDFLKRTHIRRRNRIEELSQAWSPGCTWP